MRTPLNVILDYTDQLRDGEFDPTTEEHRDMLGRIHFQSLELLDMIQGLLDLNRLELQRTAVTIAPVDLAELFADLQRSLPSTWMKPNVTLRWQLAESLIIESDRTKIETILRNLIHNALKYTDHGSVTVRARPDLQRQRVEVSVSDTGAGVPPEEREIIFDMFRQGSSVRGSGVGLGLYIVRRVCELLEGEVWLANSAGPGSEFVISLPLRPRRLS